MADRELGEHFIKQWRLRRRLSLRKLAGMMEKAPGEPLTSHANIQRIEKFEQPYTQEILEALSVALNASVTQLLTVDPFKDGALDEAEIVDLVELIKEKDRATVTAIIRGLPSVRKKPGRA
jgi:transcriptional regulator with XRE-family HTH domain